MKVNNLLFFLMIFFSTLRITSPIGIYFFTIVAPVAILFFSIVVNKKVIIYKPSILIISIIIFSWLGFYLFNDDGLIVNDKQYILIILMVFISSSFLYSNIHLIEKKDIKNVFSFILVFHFFMFYLSYFLWYGISYDLDFGLLTGGSPHRAFYYNGIFRATGVFEEPSIYCAYIFSFLTIRYLIDTRNDIVTYIALASMILSFSTIGIILSLLYIIITNTRFSVVHIFTSIIVIAILVIYGGDYLLLRLELLSDGSDGSTNTKIFILESFFSDMNNFVFGFGMLYKEYLNTKAYDGLGDLTLYINSFTVFGFFGVVLLVLLFFSLIKYYNYFGLRCCFLILISFFKMASFHYPYFWFYFFIILLLPTTMDSMKYNNFVNKK